MIPAKDLPMVIEKSQDEIEQIIASVQSSNLPEGTKLFIIGCINLASWIPRAGTSISPRGVVTIEAYPIEPDPLKWKCKKIEEGCPISDKFVDTVISPRCSTT